MKSRIETSIIIIALQIAIAVQATAQGTFQNFGFEAARNIPVFDPQAHPWTMPVADALPGWVAYLGTNQVGSVWYNDLALDSAAVGILSRSSSYAPAGLVVGEYCLSLQYGVTATFPQFTFGPASIGQSGQLPSDVQSIRFRATYPFFVTFAGSSVPLVLLSSNANYNFYGGDISRFAGQTGDLRITSDTHFSYLDEIQFSAEAIPEPCVVTLFLPGAGLFGWLWRKRLLPK